MSRACRQHGFTLIELLIAVVVQDKYCSSGNIHGKLFNNRITLSEVLYSKHESNAGIQTGLFPDIFPTLPPVRMNVKQLESAYTTLMSPFENSHAKKMFDQNPPDTEDSDEYKQWYQNQKIRESIY